MSESVAWLFRGHFYDTDPSDWTVHEHPNVPVIPLYTHPAELTDEEIMEIYDKEELYKIDEGQMYLKPIEFAKELLKKASEK